MGNSFSSDVDALNFRGTTPNGLDMDIGSRGEVCEVDLLLSFFTYGREQRLCVECELGVGVPTVYRALRRKYLARFYRIRREGSLLWQLREGHERHHFEVENALEDVEEELRRGRGSEAKGPARRKSLAQLVGLRKALVRNEEALKTSTRGINNTIDDSAIARGQYLALEYVHDGTKGTRPHDRSFSWSWSERMNLAAGRNEATRWHARDSDEISVFFYLD